jgi:hypothetical protein
MIKRIKKHLVKRNRPEAIHVMATEQEKDQMREAAENESLPLSAWLRNVGLKAARRSTGKRE